MFHVVKSPGSNISDHSLIGLPSADSFSPTAAIGFLPSDRIAEDTGLSMSAATVTSVPSTAAMLPAAGPCTRGFKPVYDGYA